MGVQRFLFKQGDPTTLAPGLSARGFTDTNLRFSFEDALGQTFPTLAANTVIRLSTARSFNGTVRTSCLGTISGTPSNSSGYWSVNVNWLQTNSGYNSANGGAWVFEVMDLPGSIVSSGGTAGNYSVPPEIAPGLFKFSGTLAAGGIAPVGAWGATPPAEDEFIFYVADVTWTCQMIDLGAASPFMVQDIIMNDGPPTQRLRWTQYSTVGGVGSANTYVAEGAQFVDGPLANTVLLTGATWRPAPPPKPVDADDFKVLVQLEWLVDDFGHLLHDSAEIVQLGVNSGSYEVNHVEKAPDGTLWSLGFLSGQYKIDFMYSTDDGATWAKNSNLQLDGATYSYPEGDEIGFTIDQTTGHALFSMGNNSYIFYIENLSPSSTGWNQLSVIRSTGTTAKQELALFPNPLGTVGAEMLIVACDQAQSSGNIWMRAWSVDTSSTPGTWTNETVLFEDRINSSGGSPSGGGFDWAHDGQRKHPDSYPANVTGPDLFWAGAFNTTRQQIVERFIWDPVTYPVTLWKPSGVRVSAPDPGDLNGFFGNYTECLWDGTKLHVIDLGNYVQGAEDAGCNYHWTYTPGTFESGTLGTVNREKWSPYPNQNNFPGVSNHLCYDHINNQILVPRSTDRFGRYDASNNYGSYVMSRYDIDTDEWLPFVPFGTDNHQRNNFATGMRIMWCLSAEDRIITSRSHTYGGGAYIALISRFSVGGGLKLIRAGADEIGNIAAGDTMIDAAYLGADLVWSSGPQLSFPPGVPTSNYFTGGDFVTDTATHREHTFLNSGTLTFVDNDGLGTPVDVEYLIVGGGGNSAYSQLGGGGGGGVVIGSGQISASSSVVVGDGGFSNGAGADQGGDSLFNGETAIGGGGGGNGVNAGTSGGSGGGGFNAAGGSGTPGQGFDGGSGNGTFGGGGGGAGQAGGNAEVGAGGAGGDGVEWPVGSGNYYGGGGGGGGGAGAGLGGLGGGGDGGNPGSKGEDGKGGGAGGRYNSGTERAGGSGVVIVRYPVTRSP